MNPLSKIVFYLYFAACRRMCQCHMNTRHFGKPNSDQVSIKADHLVPGVRSMLFCASVCSRYSQCLGYRFSADGKCYIGVKHHQHMGRGSSYAVNFILKGDARCGAPPRQANARVSYEGNVIATYTCDEDYRALSNSVSTVCQSTGKWDTVDRGCKRYRWRNPPKTKLRDKFKETIPFWNEAKNMYVKVKGKPTKDRSFALELRHQSYILFQMAARFRFHYDVKKIVLNTCKAGNWGREIRKTDFPFSVGKTLLLEITYSDGEYKVQVNHRDLLTFMERYPHIRPTYLTIRGDFIVELVEMYYKYNKLTT